MTIEKLRIKASIILKDETLTDYETFENLLGLLQENENLISNDSELIHLKESMQLIFENRTWEHVGASIDKAFELFNVIRYEVQDWMGNLLKEFYSLSDADYYKDSICEGDDDVMEDIYIIGYDINDNEVAPQW